MSFFILNRAILTMLNIKNNPIKKKRIDMPYIQRERAVRLLRSFPPIFFMLAMSVSLLIAAELTGDNDQDSSESTGTSVENDKDAQHSKKHRAEANYIPTPIVQTIKQLKMRRVCV